MCTRLPYIAALLALLLTSALPAQETAATKSTRMGIAATEHWRVGVRITAQGGPCQGLFATVPVPTDWPEQTVRVVNEEISPQVKKVDYRMIDGSVKQLLVSIPSLRPGESAQALVTFEIDRRPTDAPEDTSQLVVPKRVGRDLRRYLGPSPFIESRHRNIREIEKELVDDQLLAWEQVEKFYDWVRENITYENGKLKGALAALKDKTGDCEELTSLFIAICRVHGVPARTVWVPGHCYPEFYLENTDGEGEWYPCQAAGARMFGEMTEPRPILQKGDNFKVPEKKERQRYVAEFLTGTARKGGGRPQAEFIREATHPE